MHAQTQKSSIFAVPLRVPFLSFIMAIFTRSGIIVSQVVVRVDIIIK